MKENFMNVALEEAKKAILLDEVPVGAIIVKDNKVIARAHNLRENLNDSTAHAEIIAIREACRVLNSWRLTGCDMYVTLEPCIMCTGAIIQSRIRNLYIGTFDPRGGACGTIIDLPGNDAFNHRVNVIWEYEEQCSDILSEFFQCKRGLKR